MLDFLLEFSTAIVLHVLPKDPGRRAITDDMRGKQQDTGCLLGFTDPKMRGVVKKRKKITSGPIRPAVRRTVGPVGPKRPELSQFSRAPEGWLASLSSQRLVSMANHEFKLPVRFHAAPARAVRPRDGVTRRGAACQ
jgi:hypothetical protein